MSTDEEIGRSLVADQQLKPFRQYLGFTSKVMAAFLYTTVNNYNRWERRPETVLWASTAARIGRFHRMAATELETLARDGIDLKGLVPLHIVAQELALPHELLMRRYGDFKTSADVGAVDLGILGLWVPRKNVSKLARRP
jgi:hypothetical protein